MAPSRDPKAYYIALGISEDADADAIKSAYRSKAKKLHPDFNPSPIAAKQFHRLHEAYETLSDPVKRAAYDKPWRTDAYKAKTSQEAGNGDAEPRRDVKPDRPKDPPREARTQRASSASSTSSDKPALCKCGKVTAQPRYIVFDLVWGRLNKVQRRGVSGIFCRSCADRTALRSSLITWLAGWWAWPNGPKETVKALLNNFRGGRKPPDRNARLLIRQARAFRARGEMELARSAAEQALAFAATPLLRHEVDSLLLSLSSHPARALKDRWAKPGWSATAQLLPLALVVGVIAMSATLLAPISLTGAATRMLNNGLPQMFSRAPEDAPPLADNATIIGRVFSVSAQQANLRTGPGNNYQLLSVLKQGSIVLVTESDPSGVWLRVTTADGANGFMNVSQLSPDVRVDALEEIGGFGKRTPTAPPAPSP
jgi:hypothetical protein